MKKIFSLLFCLLAVGVWGGEPLMLVKPSREIFVNFPSAILPDKAVSVFLPEPAVPLRGKYPVVYILGAVPTDAPAAQDLLKRSVQKAILVGLNVTEADMVDTAKITAFFTRELIPYIDTNYPTLDQPQYRVLAASGTTGAKAVSALLTRKQLAFRAALLNSGTQPLILGGEVNTLRVLAGGTQSEIAAWTQNLQEKGLLFGPGFVTRFTQSRSIFDVLDLDYLFAPDAGDLRVDKLAGEVTPKTLYNTQTQAAHLALWAVLANGMRFEVVPVSLKLAPPYISWDSAQGTLTPVPGARPGTVKISAAVDNITFRTKIKLKK